MSSESKYENSKGNVLHTYLKFQNSGEEKKGQHPLSKSILQHEYYNTLNHRYWKY